MSLSKKLPIPEPENSLVDPITLAVIVLKACVTCFDEDTQVIKNDGKSVAVKDLTEGDRILSIKDASNPHEKFYDEVTNATLVHGSFAAHKLVFSNGKSITVTSPHLMMILKDSIMQMVAAKDVQVHDIMCFENSEFSAVTETVETLLPRKMNIATKTGLFFANDLLTTGMCENIPKILPAPAKDIQTQFMATDHHYVYA